jgi:4-hydroxy-tetrahydrodipicolinate reductase
LGWREDSHSSFIFAIFFVIVNIVLLGYGKMGREVEAAALAAGHRIVATFDIGRHATADILRTSGGNVAIDFSQPNAVEANVKLCAEAGLPIVIGTTGWDSALEKVRKIVDEAGIGCAIGSNFSVGVNLFLQIVREASKMVSHAGYDAYIIEAHHREKKDFPSGTALRISEAVLSGLKSKTKITSELPHGQAIASDALLISSIRAGAITGTHTVGFDSDEDSIELTHRAKNRRGFASGAVRAAEWIVAKKGLYRFENHIKEILERT